MTNISTYLILITAMMLMTVGVYHDYKYRKYPNSVIISIIILGLFYGVFTHTLISGVLGLVLMNIFGIFMYKWQLLSPGDAKFLSALLLYLDILSIVSSVIFIIMLLIVGSIYGIWFYKFKFKTKEAVKAQLYQEINSLKYLLVFKVNTFKSTDSYDYGDLEALRKSTMPFTLPIFIAFLATQIIVLFV